MQEVSATLWIVVKHLTVATIACVLLSGYAFGGEERAGRGRRSSRCPPASTTTQIPVQKVKILVKPIPKPGGKAEAENEISGKDEDMEYGDPGYSPDLSDQHIDFTDCHDPGPDIKATVPEDSDSWKTQVIIACTIAAAVEIIIILVIIVYWREIRWTMRKITCPCDERPNRHGDHEAMERTETTNLRMPPPEQRDLIQHTDLEDFDPDGLDAPSQTFRHPSRSRTQEALDEMAENTTPV